MFLENLARHLSDLHQGLQDIGPGLAPKALAVAYPGLSSISLDQGRMEKADNVAETAHRLENPGLEPLCLIEVQTGDYLAKDDIVRLADGFWRVKEKGR